MNWLCRAIWRKRRALKPSKMRSALIRSVRNTLREETPGKSEIMTTVTQRERRHGRNKIHRDPALRRRGEQLGANKNVPRSRPGRNQSCGCRAAAARPGGPGQTEVSRPGSHASQAMQSLPVRSDVHFRSQCGAVNAGGRSLCNGSTASWRKARRKLEGSLMPRCASSR